METFVQPALVAEGDGGVDFVFAAGQGREHAQRVGAVGGFAQYDAVENDGGVGGQQRQVG